MIGLWPASSIRSNFWCPAGCTKENKFNKQSLLVCHIDHLIEHFQTARWIILIIAMLLAWFHLWPCHPKHNITAVLPKDRAGHFIFIIERPRNRRLPTHSYLHVIGSPFKSRLTCQCRYTQGQKESKIRLKQNVSFPQLIIHKSRFS